MKNRFVKILSLAALSLMSLKSKAQDKVTGGFNVTAYAESAQIGGGKWIPVLTLMPDVKLAVNLSDKVMLRGATGYYVLNWNNPGEFEIWPDYMYAGASVKTNVGNFGIRAGHIAPNSGYSLTGMMDMTSPLSAYFITMNLGTGGNLPRTVLAEWSKNGDAITVGYAEMDAENSGFGFNGNNPTFVAMAEKSFANGVLKIKGDVRIGRNIARGAIYATARPLPSLELLANCVNIGTQSIGASAGQRYSLPKMKLQLTEVWQKNGVTGAYASAAFPFGAYVSAGAVRNDPRFELNFNLKPYISIGYARTFGLGK